MRHASLFYLAAALWAEFEPACAQPPAAISRPYALAGAGGPQPQPQPQPEPAELPAPTPTLPERKGGQGQPGGFKLEPLEPLATLGIPRPGPHADTAEPAKVLPLALVFESVDQHYPLLQAAYDQRGITAGKALAALGAFDTVLTGQFYVNGGSYDNFWGDTYLKQPLLSSGADLFAGYRIGRGEFPSYYGRRLTAAGGELGAGAQVPLLRGRDIDARRATIQKAELDRRLAEPDIARQRLGFSRDAAVAYWNWVAGRRRLTIAEELLRVAEERDKFLTRQLEKGKASEFDVLTNRQLVVDRRSRLVQFRRGYEQASINLSLFLRDDAGHPVRPDAFWEPPGFPEPAPPRPDRIAEDVDLALRRRPELPAFQLQRNQLRVDLAAAENLTLPGLDLYLKTEQDMGDGTTTLDRETYVAGAIWDVPLQRRLARGQILSTQAALAQLNARERFARDKIVADVENAVSAVTRAYELRVQAGQAVAVAGGLLAGELERFNAGKSNILFVNIRELSRGDTELQEIDALLRYYEALSDYFTTLGLGAYPLVAYVHDREPAAPPGFPDAHKGEDAERE